MRCHRRPAVYTALVSILLLFPFAVFPEDRTFIYGDIYSAPLPNEKKTSPFSAYPAMVIPSRLLNLSVKKLSIEVPIISPSPVIDGILDEAVWSNAGVAKNFWVIEQQRWPTEKTEVMILADSRNLYFAFRCYDKYSELISSLETRRDAGLGQDDQILVELDTFHNHRDISKYSVNSLGTQHDVIATGRARNLAWKGDWKAVARVTEYGWVVEIEIPFSILNFNPADKTFGVNFKRYHNRTDEWSSWANLTLQYKKEEMGHLTGLQLPKKSERQPWTLMPYILGGRNIPDRNNRMQEELLTGGLDVRYEPQANRTWMVSFNPDFSQIESQVTSIDFDYNEKSLDEARPFFQEGASYFAEDNTYFYSRRIPDFDYGTKYFSQEGRSQLGALWTSSPLDRKDYVLRLAHDLDIDSTNNASLMLVGTQRQDLENHLIVGQFNRNNDKGFSYNLELAGSKNTDAVGIGAAQILEAGQAWDFINIGSTLDHYDVDFSPANGLVKQDKLDTEGVGVNIGYYRDFSEGLARIISGEMGWNGRNTSEEGLTQTRQVYAGGSIELRQQVQMGLYYSEELYRPVKDLPGNWSSTLNEDYYWNINVDFNTRSSRLGYGASHSWGFLGGGDYAYTTLYIWANPTNTTSLNVTTERTDYFGVSDQTVITATWDITPQSGVATRYIVADDNNYFRVAYRLSSRHGLDTFVVYDDEPDTPEKISVKLVYSFGE